MVAPSLLMVLPCTYVVVLVMWVAQHLTQTPSTYLFIVDELVHATWPQCGSHCVHDSHACVDVANQLWLTLAGVRALFE